MTGKEFKLASIMFKHLLDLYNMDIKIFTWLKYVQLTLNQCGFGNIRTDPFSVNGKWLSKAVKLRLKDQYIQEWKTEVMNTDKCFNYRLYKVDFSFENYLVQMFPRHRNVVCKFRTLNHKLPIETGRYTNVPRHQR